MDNLASSGEYARKGCKGKGMGISEGRAEIYADMLTVQAALQFPFERHFYETPSWAKATTVLDFGCGNAAYASILSQTFPGKHFIGVELDPEMRAIAQRSIPSNITIVGSLSDVPVNLTFDFVLLRLVLLHVANRAEIYEFIDARAARDAAVVVFDAEDDALKFSPEPTQFVNALSALRAQSKNRRLKDIIAPELSPFGFRSAMDDSIVVNSSFPHAKEGLFKYMYRTAELGVGAPLPESLQRELVDWWLRDPYVQYGFFGQMYLRGSVE